MYLSLSSPNGPIKLKKAHLELFSSKLILSHTRHNNLKNFEIPTWNSIPPSSKFECVSVVEWILVVTRCSHSSRDISSSLLEHLKQVLTCEKGYWISEKTDEKTKVNFYLLLVTPHRVIYSFNCVQHTCVVTCWVLWLGFQLYGTTWKQRWSTRTGNTHKWMATNSTKYEFVLKTSQLNITNR